MEQNRNEQNKLACFAHFYFVPFDKYREILETWSFMFLKSRGILEI